MLTFTNSSVEVSVEAILLVASAAVYSSVALPAPAHTLGTWNGVVYPILAVGCSSIEKHIIFTVWYYKERIHNKIIYTTLTMDTYTTYAMLAYIYHPHGQPKVVLKGDLC